MSTDRPAILSPISRHLVVSDVMRSVAFYRDVLGFDTAPNSMKSPRGSATYWASASTTSNMTSAS
jgi:catechol-2,3-dioxygenase